MFGRLYKGELKKLARPGAMIALSVVLVLFFIVYAALYNFIADIEDNIEFELMGETGTVTSAEEEDGYIFTEESVSISLRLLQEEYDQINQIMDEEKYGYMYYGEAYQLKARIAALKYIRSHKLYGTEVKIMGMNYLSNGSDAESFLLSYMSIVAEILLIYGIVVGAGSLAEEYKKGTIKLLLTRPISKKQLISAKLLAMLTVTFGFFVACVLISYIYGLIAFDSSASETVYLVFNASSVLKSKVGAYTFASVFLQMAEIGVFTLLAYTVGSILKKKSASVVLTLLVAFGLVSGLLSSTPATIGLLSTNTDLLQYFSAYVTALPAYGNFYISLAVYVAYIALITFLLYFVVEKRDVV